MLLPVLVCKGQPYLGRLPLLIHQPIDFGFAEKGNAVQGKSYPVGDGRFPGMVLTGYVGHVAQLDRLLIFMAAKAYQMDGGQF